MVQRVERINPRLNAVITTCFDEAREQARRPREGALAGVPFLYKDLGAGLAGQPRYRGSPLLRDRDCRRPVDTQVAVRFRDAGLVPLGRTNVPELGLQPTTQPIAFGPTRNPWSLTHSPGGSSGGAAAAVCSGLVALAHASDGGGSTRIPASWCGLVGLKPSRGRVSIGAGTARHVSEFVLTRSVRDAALALDLLHGNVPGELFTACPPVERYVDAQRRLPPRFRVGLMAEAPGVAVDPACSRAAEATAALLESLGHYVEPASPADLHGREYHEDYVTVRTVGLRRTLEGLEALLQRPLAPEDVEPYTWALAAKATGVSATQYLEAQELLQGWAVRVASWWGTGFDLLLTPTAGTRPLPLSLLVPPATDPLSVYQLFSTIWCFTAPFNMTGHPAISLPAGLADGLPLGTQLVADMGRDDLLLQVAAQLQEAEPWGHRPPASE